METEGLYNLFLKYRKVTTDSRKVEQDAIFFALKGENFNGNSYASVALDNGCSYAVIDEDRYCTSDRHILVADVLTVLQQLAAHHRKHFRFPVIGITGTNGKTTTKELIHAVLSQKYNVMSTKGNFNNHIGVPLTLLAMNETLEFGVVEMGANHPGEIEALCKIAQPGYGLITNIGKAHIEGFGSFEGVVRTKKELYDYIFDSSGKVFINTDSPILTNLVRGKETIGYGTIKKNWCTGKCAGADPFLELKWSTCNRIYGSATTRLIGGYNFENALAAVCVGAWFGVDATAIKTALESYLPSDNRSQIVKTNRDNTLLLDAYNANPTSMHAAILNFHNMNSKDKVLIIGDMLELGTIGPVEHERILTFAADKGFGRIMTVGPLFAQAGKRKNCKAFNDIEELQTWLRNNPIHASTILLKASRGISLEKVVEYL
ncbi:MAG: UDP-N-acetylmuramoyl-tripeptide--D-alanyl-D-alanine ligase [Bacteroidetes bacterium]|nr:UDP-N-acetylmuramoyl-tripeptide--D-alanyl-D-alanine ligase [Bacteroidota bacterium]